MDELSQTREHAFSNAVNPREKERWRTNERELVYDIVSFDKVSFGFFSNVKRSYAADKSVLVHARVSLHMGTHVCVSVNT